jgi:metal-responsive CopG/Arc/MetJ family transcriptional regulator
MPKFKDERTEGDTETMRVRLTSPLIAKIDRLSRESGVSRSEYLRHLVLSVREDYLEEPITK